MKTLASDEERRNFKRGEYEAMRAIVGRSAGLDNALRLALRRIADLHFQHLLDGRCSHCQRAYPCPTRQLARAALDEDDVA